jgi:hypothetical protein
MDVPHDIVCSLMEKPFSQRRNEERFEIVSLGRPVQKISILSSDKKHGQSFYIQAISGYVPAFLKISYFVGHVYF